MTKQSFNSLLCVSEGYDIITYNMRIFPFKKRKKFYTIGKSSNSKQQVVIKGK